MIAKHQRLHLHQFIISFPIFNKFLKSIRMIVHFKAKNLDVFRFMRVFNYRINDYYKVKWIRKVVLNVRWLKKKYLTRNQSLNFRLIMINNLTFKRNKYSVILIIKALKSFCRIRFRSLHPYWRIVKSKMTKMKILCSMPPLW